MPAPARRSTSPRDERHLRPDDDEVDALALDRGDEPVDVLDGDVEQARVGGDAGVAGRAQQLGLLRRALQRAHDRVLAPAGADDEDLHVRASYELSMGIADSVS